MTTRIAFMLVGLLLATPCLAVASVDNYGSRSTDPGVSATPTPERMPDLIVQEIGFEQSPSKIRVRFINQGNSSSSSCYLALQSLAGDYPALGTEQRVWTTQIPALAAGKGSSSVIDVSPLKQVNGPWRATIDRSNEVKESNENNNFLIYPVRNPGPLPPRRRLADLWIYRFCLTDSYPGSVAVGLANKGGYARRDEPVQPPTLTP
ncbi:MAG: CARDB domain-containing protein [Pyrinomonadaceae bacterium]